MYGIAGAVAEAIGGMSYADLMRVHLFEPLGMSSSFVYEGDASDHEGFAKSYIILDGEEFEVPYAALR